MSSNLKVNAILPSTGTNVAIGTAGGSITMVGNVDIDINSGISTFNDIHISDKIVHDGDTNTSLRFPAADTFSVETAGSERLRIDSSGNVNITGVTTAANFKTGVSNLHDVGLTLSGGQIDVGSNIKIGTAGVTTAASFHASTAFAFTSNNGVIQTGSSGHTLGIQGGATNMGGRIELRGGNATGDIRMFAQGATSTQVERLRITSGGQVRIANTTETVSSGADDLVVGTTSGERGITILSGNDSSGNIYFGDTNTSGTGNRMGSIRYVHSDGSDSNYMRFSTSGNAEKLRITYDGKVGINETSPENELHISGTTGTAAGGLLRLDANTGDNFIIFDNTADSSEWVIGTDSSTLNEFRLYYNGGSGYGDPIINVDGTANNGKVTIDGGTSTLVNVRANSSGTAGLRCGGNSGAGSDQCTGYVEVHQDESHGGGFFYNGDGSPSFASSNESADYFSIHRLSGGQRHVLQRWFHSGNDCEMFGNLLIDNGNTTTLKVRGNSSGTAGVRAGGSSGSGSNQCTGYLEAHQDEAHGGGISYNGDGSPGFVNNETADHITFYRMSNGTRERVFSYPYNSNAVSFRGGISATSKSFRITHPHPSKKDTHDLIHSSIEGPQCDNIYRGKVDLVGGTATVNIDTVSNMTDGTFVLLNRDIQCFTTNETGWTNVKGSVTGNILTIIAQDNTCTDTISWMVVGERQDDTIKSSEIETTDADGKLIVELLKGS